jgi:hypothetical protein
VGSVFKAEDGGIEVTVLRVGSAKEIARFGIRNLKQQKATYTVIVHKKSGTDPDRIKYETDNPRNAEEYDLSADETVNIQILREQS